MKASVIIPAYNEEKYIEGALKSVSHPDVEVIVVCNACTDKTADVARKYTKHVYVTKEAGVSRARNYGASKASSDKLIFLDADISVSPTLLNSIIDSRCNIGTSLVKADSKNPVYRAVMFGKGYSHRFGFCTGMIFCDKDLFSLVGGFDESLCAGEDGKFLRAAKRIGKYGVVKDYVFNNMRRFERLGIAGVVGFWVKRYFIGEPKSYKSFR